MYNATMLTLTKEQLQWMASRIPDPVKSPLGSRPPVKKLNVLRGIFWILDNGAKWKSLPREFGLKSAVHRWFSKWVKDGLFEKIMREAGRCIENRGDYRLYECYVDGPFCEAKGGGDGIGATKAGNGVKIMVLVDARGLPVSIDTLSATPHESQLVQPLMSFMLTEEQPERVIGDKTYDSDALDEALAEQGIEMIAPHRSNRKPERVTQDGRSLRRYERRWTVERTIAWLQNLRRLCIRWEKSTTLFRGLVHLGCAFILLKEVLG